MDDFKELNKELRHYLAWIGTGVAIAKSEIDNDARAEIMDIALLGESLPPNLAKYNDFYKKAVNFAKLSKWCFENSDAIMKVKDKYGSLEEMSESQFLEFYGRFLKSQKAGKGNDETARLGQPSTDNPNST